MSATASLTKLNTWFAENGLAQLEVLLRSLLFGSARIVFVVDDDRHCWDASAGALRVLGLQRRDVIGRPLDGELHQEAEFARGKEVMPGRYLLPLRDNFATVRSHDASHGTISAEEDDYAFYLLDNEENVVAWYAGAERIYEHKALEVVGQHVSSLSEDDDASRMKAHAELQRVEAEGHFWSEGWASRKGGALFWANVITIPVNDSHGKLQGFARVVRDFSDRRKQEDKSRRLSRASLRTAETVGGIVSGEFEQILEANDTLLALLGYSREDLIAGTLSWTDVTPSEYAALDANAHEECLRFGACAPFEKELIRKDGTRVPVLATMATLKICPFRWITFLQDLRERDRFESIDGGETESTQDFSEMVGRSAALKRILRQVEVVAPTDATVLILGETGTGKELVARAVHRLSPRKNFPCISLNCAAIPTGLLESELFGYERGAFTGALSQKIGRFEMAHRGTLFLDEVGDIPLDLQPKLLRALQEKSFERLGGTRTIPIDVRLVAATNRNLAQMMGDKLFRSDLYYRLKVFPITVPPLRDRPDDIPELARYFTRKYAVRMNRHIDKIPSEQCAC